MSGSNGERDSLMVAHVTKSTTSLGGGVAVAMRSLTQALAAAGCEGSVFGLSDDGGALGPWGAVDQFDFPARPPSQLGVESRFREGLVAARPTILHSHGLWSVASRVTPQGAQSSACPWIVSPHGMLDPWALDHSRWKKRLARHWFEDRHLKGASCLHALCAAEAEAMRAYGLTNPIAVIPNGVDLPLLPERHGIAGAQALGGAPWNAADRHSEKVLLYIGRLHSKKGLLEALPAWREARDAAKARGDREPWKWVIAGWDQEGYEGMLKQRASELGVRWTEVQGEGARCPADWDESDLVFAGPVFGEKKDGWLRRADAFILPSFSEGLPMAVLEAWAYGVPVMMTDHCHLPEGFHSGAALRIEPERESIRESLSRLFSMSIEVRRGIGMRGRALVEESYTWESVAQQMLAVYRWVASVGERPACVQDALSLLVSGEDAPVLAN